MATSIDRKELNLILSVIKKYYELGMTQEQIAKEEFISKSSVCRIIKRAQESNLVTYHIEYPEESVRSLEDELHDRFRLEKVFVLPQSATPQNDEKTSVLKSLAEDLAKMLAPDDVLSISCSNVMNELADVLDQTNNTGRSCARVVTMNGLDIGNRVSLAASRNIVRIARFFSAKGYVLPVPFLLDNSTQADLIKKDSHIKTILDMAYGSRIAIVDIESLQAEDGLYGDYAPEARQKMIDEGAVGNIAGRCFDQQGKPLRSELESCMIGMDLDSLRKKEIRIGVVLGEDRAHAAVAALAGNYINMLYTDEKNAREMIRVADYND